MYVPATLTPEVLAPVEEQVKASRRTERRFTALTVAVATLLTAALSWASGSVGFGFLIAMLLVVALAVLVIRWPIVGLYVVLGCAVLIEQEPIAYPILTDRLNIFSWPPKLQGVIERPIGFFMLFVVLILLVRRFATRQTPLRLGPFILPFATFLLAVALGIGHGLASGGNFKIIVLEIRPFEYLFLSYLLAANLITEKRQLRVFIWIVIIAAGIKGLQGTYIFFVVLKGHAAGVNEIMAHEESFFFVSLLLLILLFVLHVRYRWQLAVALFIVPPVLVALIANNRRADYVAFLIAAFVVWGLLIVIRPQSRGKLITGLVLCGVLAAGYVLIFSHVGGVLGEPARGIVNAISPAATDQRDILSNQYRTIEDYDLKFTERQSPILGYGFGKPFIQAVTLPNIVQIDPYYLYIPHNTILWIWMRLGPFGYLALWYLVGAIIIRACLAARRLRDPFLQLVAVYIVGVTCMEVILAWADYQLFFYRNVIYLGLLIGVLARLPVLDARERVIARSESSSFRPLAPRSATAPHEKVTVSA
jgi:hypothetical protein